MSYSLCQLGVGQVFEENGLLSWRWGQFTGSTDEHELMALEEVAKFLSFFFSFFLCRWRL